MTAQVRIDHDRVLQMKERFRTIVHLVRSVRVVNVDLNGWETLTDALALVSIPAVGDQLESSTPNGAKASVNLVCTERNVTIVDSAAGTVDVELVYEHPLNEGQSFDQPFYGFIVGEVRAALTQVESNVDAEGKLIIVEHTYDANDKDFAGQTIKQGGKVQFFQPQITATYKGIKKTNVPWIFAKSIVGKINLAAWNGGDPMTWMCTQATWRPYQMVTGGNRYSFEFEFQYNPDTWNPTAVFIDERTGHPPADLKPGIGYKQVQKHQRVNFEAVLGTKVQGG